MIHLTSLQESCYPFERYYTFTPTVPCKNFEQTSLILIQKKVEELPKPEESQLLGEFHLGSVFSLEDYISKLHAPVFPGEEILLDKNGAAAERFFIVAESFFLTFEVFDKARNTIKLVNWTHVHSIANIKKSKEDKRKLVVTWINKKKQVYLLITIPFFHPLSLMQLNIMNKKFSPCDHQKLNLSFRVEWFKMFISLTRQKFQLILLLSLARNMVLK